MGFLQMIQLLFKILPLIHPIVTLVEQLFPNAGQGAAKLDAAINAVQTILPTVGATAEQIAAMNSPVVPGAPSPIAGAVNAVVGLVNASGGFPKAQSAAAPLNPPSVG